MDIKEDFVNSGQEITISPPATYYAIGDNIYPTKRCEKGHFLVADGKGYFSCQAGTDMDYFTLSITAILTGVVMLMFLCRIIKKHGG